VSRYLSHCPEDSLVQRGLASLGGHVGAYRPNRRKHVSSLSPAFMKRLNSSDTSRPCRSAMPSIHGDSLLFKYGMCKENLMRLWLALLLFAYELHAPLCASDLVAHLFAQLLSLA
jgi:hypothetical protein